MAGLTAKVFRTYNASITLQQQLQKLTNSEHLFLSLSDLSFLSCLVSTLALDQSSEHKTHD